MSGPLLRVDRLSKRFGGFVALDEISVDIQSGERFGLIGPNGSGKTTLINCISGALGCDGGTITFRGERISHLPGYVRTRRGIARSFQIPRPFKSMTVLENLLVALDFAAPEAGRSAQQSTAGALAILETVGLSHKAGEPSSRLSQVELRKLELARAVAARPRLLISDEAMAGLSGSEVDEILDLLRKLNREGITIIMIEHIMHAVMRFSERVMCLDAGKIICEGTPQQVIADRRVQEAYLGA
jgi:branched-chain amino acid transport system ATP-binding protein